MDTPIRIERLDADSARSWRGELGGVLQDCVDGGASVSFMAPFTHEAAQAAFESIEPDVASGRRVILAAFAGDDLADDFFLTIAPKIAGGEGPRILEGALADVDEVELAWLLESGSELFAVSRHVVTAPHAGPARR